MSDIVWQDPPDSPTSPHKWAQVIAELQQHPGRWALVYHKANGSRPTSHYTHLRLHGCESAVRKSADGGWDVYARWPEDGGGATEANPNTAATPRA